MIDHQLTDQIDYRLVDNHLATHSQPGADGGNH